MKHTFIATNLPVLILSYDRDTTGQVIPPEAHVRFKAVVPVTFADSKVGLVRLRRRGNEIHGDMEITTEMADQTKALKMMRRLYPAVGFIMHQWNDQTILDLEVTEVALTPAGNFDVKIEALGDRLVPKPDRQRMH